VAPAPPSPPYTHLCHPSPSCSTPATQATLLSLIQAHSWPRVFAWLFLLLDHFPIDILHIHFLVYLFSPNQFHESRSACRSCYLLCA
jgi:hypothetical protein